jgi:hypothetical protein
MLGNLQNTNEFVRGVRELLVAVVLRGPLRRCDSSKALSVLQTSSNVLDFSELLETDVKSNFVSFSELL